MMSSRALRACRSLAAGRAGVGAAACGLSRALVAVGATATGAVALAASSASCAGARAGSSIPPFHLAIPVHDLEEAKAFYGEVLGLSEGRSSAKWQDYSLFGHQLVVHYVGEAYRVRPRCLARFERCQACSWLAERARDQGRHTQAQLLGPLALRGACLHEAGRCPLGPSALAPTVVRSWSDSAGPRVVQPRGRRRGARASFRGCPLRGGLPRTGKAASPA